MTLRIPVRHLAEGQTEAPAALVHYACTVHRTPVGESFVVFDPHATVEADAQLERSGTTLLLSVGPLRPASVRAPRELVLIQGLPKGDKADGIVRDATELGATLIVVTLMKRSVARPDAGKLAARRARWERIAAEAARQCNRGDAPRIEVTDDLRAALALVPAATRGFLMWERATEPFGPELTLALASRAPIAIVIGPEGGLDESEVDLGRARGFAVSSLGPFVLRTETVAAAALGAVRVLEPMQ